MIQKMETIATKTNKLTGLFLENEYIAAMQQRLKKMKCEKQKRPMRYMLRYEKLDLAWRMTLDENRRRRIATLQQLCMEMISQKG